MLSGEVTVTLACCCAVRPSGSRAVTVRVARPAATAVIVTVEPDTENLAIAESDEAAAYVSASPSGSAKCREAFNSAVASASTSRSSMVPTASGARLGTVATKVCVAESPSGSEAVTVTVVVPLATAVTVTAPLNLPDRDAVATPGLDDVAV